MVQGDIYGSADEGYDVTEGDVAMEIEAGVEEERLECLDGSEGCEGAVEYRMALSASGRPFPRCDAHWSKRLDTQERINRDYPDSPIAPSWFDPADAGETWDEDY